MVQAVHSYHFMSYTVTELFETKPENPIFYIRIWLLRLKLFFSKLLGPMFQIGISKKHF